MTVNRRKLLKFAAASAALTAAGRGRAAPGNDFPMGDLEAHVRMRGNLRGERTYWYYRGTIFGNQWGKITRPMLRVEGVSYSVIDQLPEGKYRYNLREAGYYSDYESGEIRETVVNPFTGREYAPEHYLSAQKLIFSPDLSVRPDIEKLPPGLDYRGVISPLRHFKDTVWSSEDLFVRMPVADAADDPTRLDFKVQTSLATLSADPAHLLDTERDFVPCRLNYQTLATFREWMGMGREPGMMSWRMTGTKCGVEDIPAAIKDRIASDHGAFFS